ncbi:MAG: BatD family protein [Kiritimatiellales bacterium]
MKLCVIGYWLLVIGLACSAQAELSVSLKPEAASLFVYEPFTLLLEVNGEAEPPQIPAGGGFTVAGITPVPSDKPPQRFRIEIIPEQAGMLTVPPFKVKTKEGSVETAPLRMAVSAPRRADEMELVVALSSTNLYVDQPVKMTVTWTSKISFTRCNELLLELPVMRNPDWEVYPLDPGVPEKERIGLPVNGERIIARKITTASEEQLTFSCMLIPRRAGLFRPAAASLSCALMETRRASSQYPSYFDNHFFNVPEKSDRFERIYLSAPVPEITVQALPETGRTARYSGIVGRCTANASVQPKECVIGQPMLLTVALSDLSFGAQIKDLPDVVMEGIGSEFQINPRPLRETSTDNSRTFTYILRPLRSGIPAVPALALQLFDPVQKTYQTIRTAPLGIRVDPDGKQTIYQPHIGDPQKAKALLTGIRDNRKESRLTMNTYRTVEFVARNAWAFWLLPPLLWLALRPWLRCLDRCRTDAAYARAVRAARLFRRAVKQDEESAWKNYLADRFNLNAESVTFETVAPELEKQNVSLELIHDIRDRFARQDTEHYAPQGTPPRKASSACELVRRIEKTVLLVLLLVCMLPAFNSDAATPDELFAQAMQMRTEQPDKAQPLFTEAALGFEPQERFVNAGNSWFFAGENGRALDNYLAAERRNPFDRQTRESITFIRAQRTDRFQTLETPAAKISGAWKQFNRWSPSTRGALLTLIYLTGWALFLTARVIGKTIPRRGWIVLSVAALIPAVSLLTSLFRPLDGVVIESTEARLGPGYAYDAAYDTPLHEATEFQWLENRNGWIHARMPDQSEAWIPATACLAIQ